jgi:glycosyltransferase involved in cell wall biosynthesis
LSILVEALSHTADPRVFCLSQTTEPFAGGIRGAGVEVVVVPRSRAFELRRVARLTRAFVEQEIDVVHGFLDAANVYAWAAARRARVPCVLSLRNERLRLRGFRRLLLRYSLRHTDFVIANSQAGKRFLTVGLSLRRDRVSVVPNAVVVPDPPAPDAPPNPALIGFVGRLRRQKRIDLLVDAFAAALPRLKDAKLVLAGEGPEWQTVTDRARHHGVAGHVHLAGFVQDVADLMREFSCLALPSAYEGLPNVALEAIAMGVPVVAADVGDVREIVLDGQTGYLWKGTTAESLADLIVRAATDGALRKRVAVEGPALARSKYGVEASVGELMGVYEKVTVGR